MGEWTTAQVQDRLELAAGVMRQMPGVMPQGFFNAWPEYFYSFADKAGQEPQLRRPRPSPRQITQAEEAMLWLRWLEPKDAALSGPASTEWRGSRSAGSSGSVARPPTGVGNIRLPSLSGG